MFVGKDGRPSLITCRNSVDYDLRMALGGEDKGHGTFAPELACACVYGVTDVMLAAPRTPNLSASFCLEATGGLN
jgi:hypothetical protein